MSRILLLTAIITLISIYYYSPHEDVPLKDQTHKLPSKVDEHDISMDEMNKYNGITNEVNEGLANYVNKPVEELLSDFGEPDRKDPSAYGYEWWVYNNQYESYMQAGVKNGTVVTIYAIGSQLNITPFKIGQSVEDIFRSTFLETEIVVNTDRGTYRFELTEEDLNIRPLVQLGDIYVQLMFDKFNGTLSSVRFLDKEILVAQRPYELVYRGDLISADEPSETEWRAIERGNELQIFDISNIIRDRFNLNVLEWDEEVADVAYGHSKDMSINNYFSHESPAYGDLSDRLIEGDVSFQMAGENIAAEYIDGPAAIEGWLNSEGHRKSLLDKNYTQLGVGVYKKYYTQNFVKPKN